MESECFENDNAGLRRPWDSGRKQTERVRVGDWIMASEKHMSSKGKEEITRELIVNGGPE